MFSYDNNPGFARGALLGVAALAAATIVTHPAFAAAAIAKAQSALTCATTGSTACVSGTNTSTGIGVAGASSLGQGVVGKSNASNGVLGTSNTNDGIFGSSLAKDRAGVVGTTPGGYGVYGFTTATGGIAGVGGSSVDGYGVYGSTASGHGIGVYGNESGTGTGVYGFSSAGIGVQSTTNSGFGLFAGAKTGTGVLIHALTGPGLVSDTIGGLAVLGRNTNGNGGDFSGSRIGLIGRAPSGGFPLVLTNGNDTVFYVDAAGNINYKGGLSTFARVANGATVRAYNPKTTLPTVEDTGTAQLVGGVAAIRLDATFAASIDPTSPYRVFVTPNGDSRGLFVAAKTANGFIVRESQGGRATVNFDYRVVATALGQAGQRMAVSATAVPQAAMPIVPTPSVVPAQSSATPPAIR